MAGGRIKGITIEIGGDTTKLDKALKGVDTNLWTIQKDLKAVEQHLKIDPSNTELLAQKQRLLAEAVTESAKRLNTLSQAAKESNRELAEGKINTQQYKNLRLETDLAAAALKKAERELADFNDGLNDTEGAAKDAADEIGEVGDAADGMGKKFSASKEVVTGLSREIGAKLVDAVIKATEETEEYREEMGKLNTAFENAGYSVGEAKRVYQDFFNILGDTGAATEASQLLANMSNKEEELGRATDILSRRYGGFVQNIPIEELVQAAKETARTGEVTGILAETLEDAGVSVADLESRLAEINERLNSGATEIIRAGESADQAKGQVGPLAETMNTLGIALMGWTPEAEQVSASLYQMAQQEESLARWTEIAAGVYGTFGDSLPIEGLIEAANETAKTGEVTGVLADALSWSGISVDTFNEYLEDNQDVSSRTALIMDTLTHTYKDAADAFYKNNDALIESREASMRFQEAMAELAREIQPLLTMVAEMAASFLEWFNGIPDGAKAAVIGIGTFVGAIGPISGLISGITGALGIASTASIAFSIAGHAVTLTMGQWVLIIAAVVAVVLALVVAIAALTGKTKDIKNIEMPEVPDYSGAVTGRGRPSQQPSGGRMRAVTASDLPHLAQGTVTRPNSPFVAVVGDNPQEPEIIAPYSTVKRAARDAMAETGMRGGAQAITINFMGDLAQLARVLHPYITSEGNRLGPNLVT